MSMYRVGIVRTVTTHTVLLVDAPDHATAKAMARERASEGAGEWVEPYTHLTVVWTQEQRQTPAPAGGKDE